MLRHVFCGAPPSLTSHMRLQAQADLARATAAAKSAASALHVAQDASADVLASLDTARRVTQSSLESMRASAPGAQPSGAALTLQRFLDDVDRVLGQPAVSHGGAPPEDGSVGSPAFPEPAAPEAENVPEPVATLVTVAPVAVEVRVDPQPPAEEPVPKPSTEDEPQKSLPPPLPAPVPTPSLDVEVASAEIKPLAQEKPEAKAAAQMPMQPLKNVRIAALRAQRSDSPPGSFGSPFAVDHANDAAPSEGEKKESSSIEQKEAVPPRAVSPSRPRVLTVPVAAASSPPPSPAAAGSAEADDGKGKKSSGWVGGALNTIFGVVAVPERKPAVAGEKDGEETGGTAADAVLSVPPASAESEPDTPTMFLAAAAAAVAAAPATPPGLESPPPSPRIRALDDSATALDRRPTSPSASPRSRSPLGMRGSVSSPSLAGEAPSPTASPAQQLRESPASSSPESPPLLSLPPATAASPSPAKSAAINAPGSVAAAFAAGAGGSQRSIAVMSGSAASGTSSDDPADAASNADDMAKAAVASAVAKLMANRGSGGSEESAAAAAPQPSPSRLSAAPRAQQPAATTKPSGNYGSASVGGAFGTSTAGAASSPAQTAAAVAARRRATLAATESAERLELLSFSRPAPRVALEHQSPVRPEAERRMDAQDGPTTQLPEPREFPNGRPAQQPSPPVPVRDDQADNNEGPVVAPPPDEDSWSWTLDSLAAALTGSFLSSQPGGDGGTEQQQGWMSSLLGDDPDDELSRLPPRRALDDQVMLPGQTKSWSRLC